MLHNYSAPLIIGFVILVQNSCKAKYVKNDSYCYKARGMKKVRVG